VKSRFQNFTVTAHH